jgi:hypothetical protein
MQNEGLTAYTIMPAEGLTRYLTTLAATGVATNAREHER